MGGGGGGGRGGGGGGGGGGNNILVVPQASQALQMLKYEVAQELGIAIPQDNYYGYMATRDTGAIGGHMVRRMVQMAETQLASQAQQMFAATTTTTR